jgi:transcription-repair coupling factor (superfamily II helicase)
MKEELIDRFGAIPTSVQNLLRVAMLRLEAHPLHITEIKGKGEEIYFYFRPDAQIKVENVPLFLQKNKHLRFYHKKNPHIACPYRKTGVVERDVANLLALTEEMIEKMKEMLL